ncbi:MAG: hypothetical protein QM756_26925 [Polyangiaceae bacterium]
MLGFVAGLLDFPVTDSLEAGGLLARALFLGATAIFFLAEGALFSFAGGALGRGAGVGLLASAALLLRLFLFDPVLLEVHQLFEREENRAFLLFGHGGVFLDRAACWRVLREPHHAGSIR